MKTFLVAVLALASVNAFAQRHMVTLSGYETGGVEDNSLDFRNSTGSAFGGSPNESHRDINLNYAFAITESIQVGGLYRSHLAEERGAVQASTDDTTTMGVQVIYNFHNKLIDTCYAALHYDMLTAKENDNAGNDDFETNTLSFEYGHRFGLGKLGGLHFTYSPSATLAFANTEPGDSTLDDSSSTVVSLNFVKFDVLF
ncbi:MAG TPA: hypothetical protein VNJ08_06675 [Bacteriovoracaceae bacterium]|nr:hypothetical protein [Bacteriovoracaceae bacterium]